MLYLTEFKPIERSLLPVRNGNLLNLKQPFSQAAGYWDGSDGKDAAGHAIFGAQMQAYVYRAFARLCYRYVVHHGLTTCAAFFDRYAPEGDMANNPAGYADFVETHAGIRRLKFFDSNGMIQHDQRMKFVRFAQVMIEMEVMRHWRVDCDAIHNGVALYNRDRGRRHWKD